MSKEYADDRTSTSSRIDLRPTVRVPRVDVFRAAEADRPVYRIDDTQSFLPPPFGYARRSGRMTSE